MYEDATALRILAHIFIVLEYLGVDQASDTEHTTWQRQAQNVCAAYSEYLFDIDKWLLVPLYACKLSPKLAGHVVAKTMPMMITPEQRQHCMQLMEECHMDVVSILAQHTDYALNAMRLASDTRDDASAPKPQLLEPTMDLMWPGSRVRLPRELEPDPQEEAAIASGQWYMFVTEHWSETFDAVLNILETLLSKLRPDSIYCSCPEY